jgi:hypothetical protein
MAELKRETLEALRPYSDDHAVTMPAEVLIVTGAKPS